MCLLSDIDIMGLICFSCYWCASASPLLQADCSTTDLWEGKKSMPKELESRGCHLMNSGKDGSLWYVPALFHLPGWDQLSSSLIIMTAWSQPSVPSLGLTAVALQPRKITGTYSGSNTTVEVSLALTRLSYSWGFHQVGNTFRSVNMNIVAIVMVVNEGTRSVSFQSWMSLTKLCFFSWEQSLWTSSLKFLSILLRFEAQAC